MLNRWLNMKNSCPSINTSSESTSLSHIYFSSNKPLPVGFLYTFIMWKVNMTKWVNFLIHKLRNPKAIAWHAPIFHSLLRVWFVWFDSLHPINNLSVIKRWVFLDWTSTKLGLIFLPKDTTQWCRWGSNLRPLGLKSSTLTLSHCAPVSRVAVFLM